MKIEIEHEHLTDGERKVLEDGMRWKRMGATGCAARPGRKQPQKRRRSQGRPP
jgi:hypothetical protein